VNPPAGAHRERESGGDRACLFKKAENRGRQGPTQAPGGRANAGLPVRIKNASRTRDSEPGPSAAVARSERRGELCDATET
jgi:hypothetical protein